MLYDIIYVWKLKKMIQINFYLQNRSRFRVIENGYQSRMFGTNQEFQIDTYRQLQTTNKDLPDSTGVAFNNL